MRFSLLFIITFFSVITMAQVKPSKTSFDFGDLYTGSQTYTDITFKNTSDKVQYLLTIDKPMDVYYIYSAKRIMPDSSITIRFQINERRKGKFKYDVGVYFSEPREAINISLSGNVKENQNNGGGMTACPDFNAKPPDQVNLFDMVVRVIDSNTREPIKNSKVYIVEKGELVDAMLTNSKGVIKKRLMLGYFYITAEKDGYNSNYYEGYMNYKRNYVEIELSMDNIKEPEIVEEIEEEEEIVEEVEEVVEIVEEEEEIVEEPEEEEVIEEEEEVEIVEEVKPDPVPEVEKVPLDELPDSVFTEGYFKYNNITFILDVSASMNGMGKMDLLRMSMIELAKILRPNDMISMIKYSSEVETVMEGADGSQKDMIIETVKGLRTSGMTAGGDAIKAAYRLNRKNYIEGGNNIVIMITDGVFNKGDKNYLKTIEKYYNSQGIIFSVVGIKTSDFITTHMKNVVSNGGGDFIRILTVPDAQTKLIEEIKRTSFRFTTE
ncbi:VWA domain-containing protein [Paracrocinitomix mangrovi]|uniref:VWA domain-containing protein n=1 Tax=Paracrocinitomix mangrovi TaxID=2862509 RepID=UPI001C8E03C1|nr:VWA domain-containing protein [Paracrocinitomix mangrovi]UKN00728.1 VWA domain-containing protein [Paracrocinitomix mangrovi]